MLAISRDGTHFASPSIPCAKVNVFCPWPPLQIVGARVVLHNGTLVEVGKYGDAAYVDLLHGLRGAAPNFGVVTQIVEKCATIITHFVLTPPLPFCLPFPERSLWQSL